MTAIEFNTFSDVQHMPLRVFNRTIMMNNIKQDLGLDKFKEYVNLFTDAEKRQMYIMQMYIKEKGYNAARKMATKDIELESEDYEQDPIN